MADLHVFVQDSDAEDCIVTATERRLYLNIDDFNTKAYVLESV